MFPKNQQILKMGTSDFTTLTNGTYIFADKSLFIRDLLQSGQRIHYLCRPPKFGKTSTLSMLESYFDVSNKNKQGDPFSFLQLHEFDAGKHSHPVILVDFARLNSSYDDLSVVLQKIFFETFISHEKKYEVLNIKCSAHLNKEFEEYRKAYNKEDFDFINSFDILLSLWEEWCKKKGCGKPVVLIDNYDEFWLKYPERVNYLMTGLLSFFKSRIEKYELVVMTGVLPVQFNDTSMSIDSIYYSHFGRYVGFTSEEAYLMVHQISKENTKETYNKIMDLYGNYYYHKGHQFCSEKDFWQDSQMLISPVTLLKYFVQPESTLLKLFHPSSIFSFLHQYLNAPDASKLARMYISLARGCYHVLERSVISLCSEVVLPKLNYTKPTFWTILLNAGLVQFYVCPPRNQEPPFFLENSDQVFVVPNQRTLLDIFLNPQNCLIEEPRYRQTCKLAASLKSENLILFTKALTEFIIVYLVDATKTSQENFYRSNLYTHLHDTLLTHKPSLEHLSNKQPDCVFIPKSDHSFSTYMFEVKAITVNINPKNLKKTLFSKAGEAIVQILNKNYLVAVKNELKNSSTNSHSVILIGLAFQGKSFMVSWAKIMLNEGYDFLDDEIEVNFHAETKTVKKINGSWQF